MSDPPSGDVTFLFTDIEGSTALWDQHPDAMAAALAEHDTRIRSVAEARDGYVFTTAGDSFAIAFSNTTDAVSAALEIQLGLSEPIAGLELKLRMGVHTGTATLRDGDYFGGAVNRAARVTASAHGGQLVVTEPVAKDVVSTLPPEIELLDLGTHRLRGLVEPERLYQLCHPALEQSFPRLRTVEGPGDALPAQLTSFVGRDREVAEVIGLVDDHRLITLSGSGGAGKTRLALHVAEQLVSEFPDGVRLAELGAVEHGDVLLDEIAQRFSVTAAGDEPLIESIATSIADRRILLVLDNCEQIVADVAMLCGALLQRCPKLCVLATSRERLGVGGEVLYRVPSLAIPEPGAGVDQSLTCDAVRLFVDRGQLVAPSFELTAENVDDVTSICRHLDGIPLAVELAAARLASMSPAQVVQRLDQRFRLLTTTDRTRVGRQGTLLSAIEWSHDLLDDREQAAFRRLGTFASDFPLEAAEQVCAGGPIDELDVLDLISSLVDKSMLTAEVGRDGSTRYRLLETLREFARRRLEEAGEQEALNEAHADFFARRAEELRSLYRARQMGSALAGLDQDEAEFRSALRFTFAAGHHVVAARLIGGLGFLWYVAGLHREGIDWCTQLFDDEPELPDELLASALHNYASLLGVTGRPALGIEMLERQIVIRRRLGDPARLGAALNNLGDLLCDTGRFEEAEPALDEAISRLREAGMSPTLALSTLGDARARAGRYEEGALDLVEAIREADEDGDAHAHAVALSGLGRTLAMGGRCEEARPHLIEARERFEELKVLPGIIDADIWLGVVERAAGHAAAARDRFSSALATPDEHWYAASCYWLMQLSASVIDDPDTAAVLVGAAAAAYERLDVAQPAFIPRDLDSTTAALAVVLDPDDLARHLRTGARRTRDEAVDLARAALSSSTAAAPGNGTDDA